MNLIKIQEGVEMCRCENNTSCFKIILLLEMGESYNFMYKRRIIPSSGLWENAVSKGPSKDGLFRMGKILLRAASYTSTFLLDQIFVKNLYSISFSDLQFIWLPH